MSDTPPTPDPEDTPASPTEDAAAPEVEAEGVTEGSAARPLLAKNLARCGERREQVAGEDFERHLADLKALADSLGGELLVTRHQHDVLGQIPRTGRTPNHAHPERRDVKFVPPGTPVAIVVDLAGLDPAVFARLLDDGAFKARS